MIQFVNVSKIYPGKCALEGISFEIEEGEFVFLVGPSGSGKTSVIKLLIKEEEPTEGDIYFYDTNIRNIKSAEVTQLRREISVVFQDFKLLPQKNIYENVAFGLEVAGRRAADIEETVPYVLQLVELEERSESFPGELSGGEKQKVAIARAIANNPKVLIADEPTGNLDPESSWEIITLLSKINQWGTTVIMATHGTDIVNSLGKRVIHLSEGRIVTDNKEGLYPTKFIPKQEAGVKQAAEGKKEFEKKVLEATKPKKKTKKKIQKRKKKEKADTKEKEFEITFTTKSRIPSKKKKTRKRKGKDVVDLAKLDLPVKLQEKIIKHGITSVRKLKKEFKKESSEIAKLTSKEKSEIKSALKK